MMARTGKLVLLLLTILCLTSLTIAASATSFCKCTCQGNSTIIQLDGQPAGSSSKAVATKGDAMQGHGTCNDCNKKFCLAYNLPICKNVNEDDVFTTCFQRDSAKDEAVVFVFIFATVGLLVYAAIRPFVERWMENYRERQSYAPISSAGAEES